MRQQDVAEWKASPSAPEAVLAPLRKRLVKGRSQDEN